MREDIIGAMKNAMDRGATPQQAAHSLINSGYPVQEVNEALSFVTGGTLNSLTPQPKPAFQKPFMMQPRPNMPQPINAMQQPMNAMPQNPLMQQRQNIQQLPTIRPQQFYPTQKQSKGGRLKTFLLFTILLIVIAALIATIFFKDEILELFG